MGAENFPTPHNEVADQSANTETSFFELAKAPSAFGEKSWNPPPPTTREEHHILRDVETPEQMLSLDKLSQLRFLSYVSEIIHSNSEGEWWVSDENIDTFLEIISDKRFSPLVRTLTKNSIIFKMSSYRLPDDVPLPDGYHDPDYDFDDDYPETVRITEDKKVIMDTDYGYYNSGVETGYRTTCAEVDELEKLGKDYILEHIVPTTWQEKKIERTMSVPKTWVPEGYATSTTWRTIIGDKWDKDAVCWALENLQYKENKAKIKQEFPAIANDDYFSICKIASDAAATFQEEILFYSEDDEVCARSIDKISDDKGNICIPGLSNNIPSIDDDSAQIIELIHGTGWFKDAIDQELSVNICKIPLASQVQLLKFMSEPNDERFDHLQKTLQEINDESLKIKLLENFTAAEFGDDFGDALLDIAGSERFSNEQKERILDDLTSAHTSISKIAQLFKSFPDKNFAKSLTRASSERLTDIVTVFKLIGETGSASANLGDHFGKTKFGYDEAIEALEYETKSLDIITGTVADVMEGKEGCFAEVILTPNEHRDRTEYNLYSKDHGYILLYTRPEGSHSFDPMFEFGKERSRYDTRPNNAGVEASISFMVNPKDPFALPSMFTPYFKDATKCTPATIDKISALRLDREGRAPNVSPFDPSRDPINPIGTISVDLSSINYPDSTPSGKIARLIATGNQLRRRKTVNRMLNHNTAWFDQNTYGVASGFRKLVEHIDSLALDWCKKNPPKPNEGFTGLKNARAKKIIEIARPETKPNKTTA